jgi:hypothetical protein
MRNKISTSVAGIIAFGGEEHIIANNCFKLINKIFEKVEDFYFLRCGKY